MDLARRYSRRCLVDGRRAGVARLSAVAGRWFVDSFVRKWMMRWLWLMVSPMVTTVSAVPVWADQIRVPTWQELVPADAPPVKLLTTPMHDLSKMADTLSMESAPAAHQRAPHAPVVKSLNGQTVRLPGYIVPLEVSEEGRVTD